MLTESHVSRMHVSLKEGARRRFVGSRTKGVRAPLTLLTKLVEADSGTAGSSAEDWEDGVARPLGTLLPDVAAMDGEAGGSGDLVK